MINDVFIHGVRIKYAWSPTFGHYEGVYLNENNIWKSLVGVQSVHFPLENLEVFIGDVCRLFIEQRADKVGVC